MALAGLSGFAGYIFLHAGVVRDVPELYIEKNNIHRGLHAEYCDRAYQYDKPFETDKQHWLVIGNSFGRDFVNTILESDIADKVEVSYIHVDKYKNRENSIRYANADMVFVSSLGINEDLVYGIEVQCLANGLSSEKLVVVGEKNFGGSNGQAYLNRSSKDYFKQRIEVRESFVAKNARLRELYGERYLDLIGLLMDEENKVPVFTPDNHYISQDCEHFSKGGAVYFSQLINWGKYMKEQ